MLFFIFICDFWDFSFKFFANANVNLYKTSVLILSMKR